MAKHGDMKAGPGEEPLMSVGMYEAEAYAAGPPVMTCGANMLRHPWYIYFSLDMQYLKLRQRYHA